MRMRNTVVCLKVAVIVFIFDRFIFNPIRLVVVIYIAVYNDFCTLELHYDLVVCGSPNLIGLCYSLVYSEQFSI